MMKSHHPSSALKPDKNYKNKKYKYYWKVATVSYLWPVGQLTVESRTYQVTRLLRNDLLKDDKTLLQSNTDYVGKSCSKQVKYSW